jgi:hypothetical protein
LNAFAAVRPLPKRISTAALERLLDDVAAFRALKEKGVARWDIVTPT